MTMPFDPSTDCVACWLIRQMGYLPTPSPVHFDFNQFEHESGKPGHVDYTIAGQP